jgi:hypothetical protein
MKYEFFVLKKMSPSICNVCAETFNKSNSAVVKCMCEFECCRQYAKTYLLGRVRMSLVCNVMLDRTVSLWLKILRRHL